MKAAILVGGLGTRIRSLYPDIPKALVPIHSKPFLQWQIELLMSQGWRSFVLCVGYAAEKIEQYFGDGTRWGAAIEYSTEPAPLGTGGAIKHAASFLRETALVLNGDTYLDMDYRALVAHHRQVACSGQVLGTLALTAVDDTSRYGQVRLGDDNRILSFEEKAPSAATQLVSAGVYVLEPALIDLIPGGGPVSLEQDVLPALAARGQLCGLRVPGRFIDMGTPAGLKEMENRLAPRADVQAVVDARG
jgi:NDP-sugar pyrophosphorylase family protein